MNRLWTLCFCLFLSISSHELFAQQLGPGIVWQKCLGGSGDDKANSIVRTVDGGFIIAGSSTSNNGDVGGHHGFPDSTDAWIVKISATGTVQWQRSVGGSGKDVFNSIIPLADGNFICMGTTTSHDGDVSSNHGSSDLWVVKISAHGALLWSKCYGGSSVETAGNIKENQDGSLYAIGTTMSRDGDVTGHHGTNVYDQDIWVVKLNSDGSINWERCFGGTSNDNGYDIHESDNGSFIIGVNNQSYDGDFPPPPPLAPTDLIVKLASDYSVIWQITFNNAKPISIEPTGTGNVYDVNTDVLGCSPMRNNFAASQYEFTDDPAAPASVPYSLIQNSSYVTNCYADATDGLQGYKTVGASGTVRVNSIDHVFAGAGDDTLAVPGFHGGVFDGFVSGYKIGTGIGYEKFLGGTQDDEFTSVSSVNAYDYVVAGFTNSTDGDVTGNHGGYDVWVVKLGRINTVKGTVYQDYNHNAVKDANEPFVSDVIVQSQKGASKSASSTYNGYFDNQVDTGTYTTTVLTTDFPYYSAVPASKSSIFSTYNNSDSISFALQPVAGLRDYAINLWPYSIADPGFTSDYILTITNKGTDTLINKQVSLVADSRMQFVSATPAASSTSGDSSSWVIAKLSPRDTTSIRVRLQLKAPPDLNYNDTLFLSASIDSTGDLHSIDNSTFLYQQVLGSFDPNSKEEVHAGSIALDDVSQGKDLLYTIRFQNTGNDTAYNIVIRDTLDTKIVSSSLCMVSASHPYSLTIQDSSILVWTFQNILLPDSAHHESASHGFVSYRIKPSNVLNIGDVIKNTSSAYFDFNLPVQTNTELTTVKKNVPAPAAPVLSALDTAFCSASESGSVKILNIPSPVSGISVTVVLDGTQTLAVGADSSFTIILGSLTSGRHTVKVSFTDQLAQTKSTSLYFSIMQPITPTLSLSASSSVVSLGSDPVIVTATADAGNGASLQYTFAADDNFQHLIQGPDDNNLFSVQPASLFIGANWIYAKLTVQDSCLAISTIIDSIKIVRSTSASGILDPDFPDQPINAYPNPFSLHFQITGLSASKQYEIGIYNSIGQQVLGKAVSDQTGIPVNQTHFAKGYYTIRIYDRTKDRLIGIIKMLCQ